MPNLPDIPGKGLIVGMTNRTRVVVGAAGTGALALGGLVARRLLSHGDGDDARPDPIAATPTAPPAAEEKPAAKPKPAKPPKPAPAPKAGKPKPTKAKAPAKPKPPKAKAAKPPKDPHHALNNPVVDDPDLTEYPDPYDTREDPLAEPDHPPGAESTSEPPLQQDPEIENGGKPPRREKLDD